MSYVVDFTPDPVDDFLGIADYIAQDNPGRAFSFIDDLQKAYC